MMKKAGCFVLIISVFLSYFPLAAGERTVPVDIFVMIDKSLSMSNPGKFDSMRQWVRDQLLGQILINDDWITVYQFYGKPDKLLTMTVKNDQDRQNLIKTIDAIKPDGQYTDIGLALDTINAARKERESNGRHKIILLLTDLKQEAPWTSRYAGSSNKFESPYLAEARILQHDSWYEITLGMDIQDQVVKTSHELFSSIQTTKNTKPENITGSTNELADKTSGNGTESATSGNNASKGTAIAGKTSGSAADSNANGFGSNSAQGKGLPLTIAVVIVSGIVLACAALFMATRIRRNKDEEQKR